jgi:hypothetical protein
MSGRASSSKKLRTLVEMGFNRNEASLAIERCGMLVFFILKLKNVLFVKTRPLH